MSGEPVHDLRPHNPYLWYWADREDAEHFLGPRPTREAAIEAALEEAERGDAVWIIEANMREPSVAIFDADDVLGLFAERNEECWNEDGDPGMNDPSHEAMAELEAALNGAFATWAAKHLTWTAYRFDQVRTTECVREATERSAFP